MQILQYYHKINSHHLLEGRKTEISTAIHSANLIHLKSPFICPIWLPSPIKQHSMIWGTYMLYGTFNARTSKDVCCFLLMRHKSVPFALRRIIITTVDNTDFFQELSIH